MNKVIAGNEAADIINAEHAALRLNHASTKAPGCIESEALCNWQQAVSRRGFCEAEIVKSIYGYYVRYASGLNDFAILAGTRSRQVNGTLEDAIRWSKEWVSQDPSRRYVTMTEEKLAA